MIVKKEAYVTTEKKDRHGDIIRTDGIDISEWLANPVVLWNHSPEKILGKAVIEKIKGGIVVKEIDFYDFENPQHELAEIGKMYEKGYINAISINVLANKAGTKKLQGGRYDIQKSVMTELSLVPIPANGEAVVIKKSFDNMEKTFEELEKSLGEKDAIITSNEAKFADLDKQLAQYAENVKALEANVKSLQESLGKKTEMVKELTKRLFGDDAEKVSEIDNVELLKTFADLAQKAQGIVNDGRQMDLTGAKKSEEMPSFQKALQQK